MTRTPTPRALARLSALNRRWLIVLRGCLVLAAELLPLRIVLLATGQARPRRVLPAL